MLYALLSCLPAPPTQAADAQVSEGAPRALLMTSLVSRGSLEGGVGPEFAEGEVVRLLAWSTTIPSVPPDDWTLGYRLALVEGPTGRGWVSGEHLMVEQSWGLPEAPNWPGDLLPERQVDDAQWWPATRSGREYTQKFGWDRRWTDGGWVRQVGQSGALLELVDENGWGSAHSVALTTQHDFNGDGVLDQLVLVHETVTEAGSVGHTLLVVDPTRPVGQGTLLSQPVFDPHWSGLDVVDRWGWMALDLPGGTLTQHFAERVNVDGESPTLRHVEQRWTWGEAGFVSAGPRASPLSGTLTAGPIWQSPPGFGEDTLSASDRVAAQSVCVDHIRGPLGTGDTWWLEATDCAGGVLGWVPNDRVTLEPAGLSEVLGPWPEHPEPALRVTWR